MAEDLEKDVLWAGRDAARERDAETIRGTDVARRPRNITPAPQYAAVERREARGSAVGFYVLLGIVALGLLIFVLASLTRRAAPQSSTAVNRVMPSVPPVVLTPPVELPSHGSTTPEASAPTVVATPPAPPVIEAPSSPSASDSTAPSTPSYIPPPPPASNDNSASAGTDPTAIVAGGTVNAPSAIGNTPAATGPASGGAPDTAGGSTDPVSGATNAPTTAPSNPPTPTTTNNGQSRL